MESCLRSFPRRSAGGPDGITPQHKRVMLARAADEKLKGAIRDFLNIFLEGNLPLAVRRVNLGVRLMAQHKKDGGIRPIFIGYTLRRLAAKCANRFVITRRCNELKPIQVGVGVSGGAEAIVHASRRLVTELPEGHNYSNWTSRTRSIPLDRMKILTR